MAKEVGKRQFSDKKKYLVSGKLLNEIFEAIRLNRPINPRRQTHDGVLVDGGGGEQDIYLMVCHNGVAKRVVIKGRFVS